MCKLASDSFFTFLAKMPYDTKGYTKSHAWVSSSQIAPGKSVYYPQSPDEKTPSWPQALRPLPVHLIQGSPAAAWLRPIQCCKGCLAPNWNDRFFFPSSGPCNYCDLWGWIQCQSKCFPYVFLSFKKEKGKKKKKKERKILNGSQQTKLPNQPPRSPH